MSENPPQCGDAASKIRTRRSKRAGRVNIHMSIKHHVRHLHWQRSLSEPCNSSWVHQCLREAFTKFSLFSFTFSMSALFSSCTVWGTMIRGKCHRDSSYDRYAPTMLLYTWQSPRIQRHYARLLDRIPFHKTRWSHFSRRYFKAVYLSENTIIKHLKCI